MLGSGEKSTGTSSNVLRNVLAQILSHLPPAQPICVIHPYPWPGSYLRCYVVWRATEGLGRNPVPDAFFAHAKISNLDVPFRIQHHIIEFQVPVIFKTLWRQKSEQGEGGGSLSREARESARRGSRVDACRLRRERQKTPREE